MPCRRLPSPSSSRFVYWLVYWGGNLECGPVVRIIEPILEAMGIEHFLIDTGSDVTRLSAAIDTAYAKSKPMVALIGGSVQP